MPTTFDKSKSYKILALNTFAFTICFAVWMMYGVLITYLVDNQVFAFSKSDMGWLIGIPVLTGAIFRLPVGVLSDRYGGKPIFAVVMLAAAGGCFLVSLADSFTGFVLAGLAFGLAGASFAVGIAYTAVWFPKNKQGTALGIFGAGNAGAAITAMGAPAMLASFTDGGAHMDGWRTLPQVYALALVVVTVIFWFVAENRRPAHGQERTLRQRLAPLKVLRVWRFGLYYFLVFGGFVALAQWLIPYYVNVYASIGITVATAGLLSAIFTLPSGVIRAFGGWLSDKVGARTVMYWTLGITAAATLFMIVPQMEIFSPGKGVQATKAGTITAIEAEAVVVDENTRYTFQVGERDTRHPEGNFIWPTTKFWQEPVASLKVGDKVAKKQLIIKGTTHIFFQANIWVFTGLLFIVGITLGIGKAAVYKHIPDYFPDDVGTVGGIVGVVGGLGGFVMPVLFGYLLESTGLWTSTWMVLFAITLICLIWMHIVIRKMMARRAPDFAHRIEDPDHIPLNTQNQPEGASSSDSTDADIGVDPTPEAL